MQGAEREERKATLHGAYCSPSDDTGEVSINMHNSGANRVASAKLLRQFAHTKRAQK